MTTTMDINDNQQINTFLKGMNTDVSDSLIDSSQYRYAENVRPITDVDLNTGELRLIEGNAPFSKLPPLNGNTIKAMTSVRDILVIITSDSRILKYDPSDLSDTDNGWQILFEMSNDNEDSSGFGDKLSLVTRWESDKNVKLYIADGVHRLMYINLKNKDEKLIGIENTLSDTDIYLSPFSNLRLLVGGKIKPAKVLYTYRLYKEGGTATTLAPLSKPVTVYYKYNEGYDNVETTVSDKSVSFELDTQRNNTLDRILIYRISYLQLGQEPTISLIYDDMLSANNIYTDVGEDIEEESVSEFLSMLKLDFTPTVIESKNDYLFAANITYKQDETDNTDFINADEYFRAISTGNIDNGNYVYNKQFLPQNILTYNKEFWYKNGTSNLGGVGECIEWEYSYYNIGLDVDNTKHKNGSVTYEQIQSLKPGEVYRYGIILYTKSGKRSSVIWIADIMAPDLYENNSYSSILAFGNMGYLIPVIGVKFTILWDKIRLYYGDNCKAVEIVRADKTVEDRLTITSGIGGFPYAGYTQYGRNNVFTNNGLLFPTGHLSINRFFAAGPMSIAGTTRKYFMFASPEYCYLPDDILNIMSSDVKMQIKRISSIPISHQTSARGDDYSGFMIGRDDSIYGNTNRYNTPFMYKINHNGLDTTEDVEEITSSSGVWPPEDNSHLSINYLFSNDSPANTAINSYWDMGRRWEYNKNPFPDPIYDGIGTAAVSSANYVITTDSYPLLYNGLNDTLYNIKNISYPEVPTQESLFDENKQVLWKDASTAVGTKTFIGWSNPLLEGHTDLDISDALFDNASWDDKMSNNYWALYPTGSIGRCILFLFDGDAPAYYELSANSNQWRLVIPTIDLKHVRTPYGGEYTTKVSTYLSFGNCQEYDGEQNVIEVYDGDCYPGVFMYNTQHAWYYAGAQGSLASSCFYAVPLYSYIDLSATYGSLFTKVSGKRYFLQDQPGRTGTFTLDKPSYMYNTAYNASPTMVQYMSLYYTSVSSPLYDTRVVHSAQKQNGETIDSWLNFGNVANFIDVDTRFGKITNLRLFKDKLLFWQEHAVGVLSVNERTVLNDLDENNIVVGTGGTLQRYDYISTVYGMKQGQYEAEVQSNTTQYWWDGYNKEILAYSEGMLLLQLSKSKAVLNYINERLESLHPMLAYDNKYNELLSQVVTDEDVQNTLVYNEQILAFTSIYTFTPLYKADINNLLYIANDSAVYVQNNQQYENYSMLFNNYAKPLIQYIVNQNSTYNKTFDIQTFGGRFYGGSILKTYLNWPMGSGYEYTDEEVTPNTPMYIRNKDHENFPMSYLVFTYNTPLKQRAIANGLDIVTVNEYDYRLAIPRDTSSLEYSIKDDNNLITKYSAATPQYGNRMRGKTMLCEIKSNSNSTDFSLLYITTKFRMSCS